MENKRAQTTLGYVCLIGLVAAAITVMLVYVSRGFQGNLREQADQAGEQYSPTEMTTNITQNSTVTFNDVSTRTESTSNSTTTMIGSGGSENIAGL